MAPTSGRPIVGAEGPPPGHFRPDGDGGEFAGLHVLADLWGASRIDDPEYVTETLHDAVRASGATLLSYGMHRFEPRGLTAFVLLAESHFALHSWPERDYASADLFTCGSTDVHAAVEVLRARFAPASMDVVEHKRGRRDASAGSRGRWS